MGEITRSLVSLGQRLARASDPASAAIPVSAATEKEKYDENYYDGSHAVLLELRPLQPEDEHVLAAEQVPIVCSVRIKS
jgi:hypothetical protein